MTVVLGNTGKIRLRRSAGKADYTVLETVIEADDINMLLNRIGFDEANDNLLTGDRVEISTDDTRGLAFIAKDTWPSQTVEKTLTAYINVNAVGGIRLFDSMQDAINNNRATEYKLNALSSTGGINITIAVRDTISNVLGNVTSYVFNTDRESIDTTTLSDKFRRQYNAGIISGSGTIDCLFNYETTGVNETPLLMLQLLNRIDIGSDIDLALYVVDRSEELNQASVFYDMTATITKAGVNVVSGDLITTSIDFVTTGEFRLLLGEPVSFLYTEDENRILVEKTLDFLVQEETD
jgi:hypothetical protein